MLQSLQTSKRVRKNFGKIKLVASIPNLIEIQKKSYEDSFLQLHLPEKERSNRGLQGVLASIFPIQELFPLWSGAIKGTRGKGKRRKGATLPLSKNNKIKTASLFKKKL